MDIRGFSSGGEVDPTPSSFKVIPVKPEEDDLFPISYDWCVPDDEG